MQVIKFGGTSVANAENIKKVRSIVGERMKNDRTIVVVSAFGGVTDHLLQCGIQASEGNADYKQSLQNVWLKTASSQKELIEALQQWCRQAEESGLEVLRQFAQQLKAYVPAYVSV